MGWPQLIGAGGSLLQGAGMFMAGRDEAKALAVSADSAYREGGEALKLARYETRLLRQAGAQIEGANVAEAGRSGLAVSGTPLATLVENARQVELSASLAARAGRIEKARFYAQGKALKRAAKAAKKGGALGGLGGVVGGIGKLL